jgi:hypothetical protein
MNKHEEYEILCALAASGRASVADLEHLNLHLRCCSDCQNRLSDFAQVSAQVLPLHGETYVRDRVPRGMTARFMQRAAAEGIAVRSPSALLYQHRFIAKLIWTAASVVAVLAAVVVIRNTQGSWVAKPQSPPSAAQVRSNDLLERDRGTLTSTGQSEQPDELRAQLAVAQQEASTWKRQAAALQRNLQASDSTKAGLSSRIATLESENEKSHLLVLNRDSHVADLERRLKEKDTSDVDEIARYAEKQEELNTLTQRLSDRERDLERERQLLTASAQARDLITARGLHIIDVHDNDHSGRERPFGRIFYVEGRSLVFYAYDLDAAARANAKVAFHVWGGSLRDQHEARKLGVFRSEDSAAGRWVLTCDDPGVLAQISTVFVTVESAERKLDQPKGKRILYAFLGDQPNHP